MTTLDLTEELEVYREILEEVVGLDVEWTAAAKGEGGIRSTGRRCPLKELHYQRTGEDRMPTPEQVGLTRREFQTFIFSVDNSKVVPGEMEGNLSLALRDAIKQATRT